MEFLAIGGVFLIPVGVASINLWLNRNKAAALHLTASLVPLALLVRLVVVVLADDRADPSVGEIAAPFILLLISFIYMWIRAFQKDRKLTTDMTTAVSCAVLGMAAARKYQRKRDQERAEALANELEQRS